MSDVTLWRGNCLELMKDIPDKSVDMVLCDLPYGTTQNKWDKKLDLTRLFFEYNRIIKANGAIALFSQMPFSCDLINANRKFFRYEWIWEKGHPGGFLNAHKMPLRSHENILVFYKKIATYHPQFTQGKPYRRKSSDKIATTNYGRFSPIETHSDGKRYPKDIIQFNTPKNIFGKNTGKFHPTQKPVNLLEYLIKTYTNEGETVLDNCMGSGSTGVACVNTNRNFIGIELDENYFQIAKNRIEETQTALGEGGFFMP